MAEPLDPVVEKALAEILDPAAQSLRGSLAERMAADLLSARTLAAEESARAARVTTAEALLVAVWRLTQAPSITEVGGVLLETAAGWAGRTALLVQKGDALAGWRTFGFDRTAAESDGFANSWSALEIPLADAPALAQTVETREAVVSLAVPDHLSARLASLMQLDPQEKVYLFPVCLRQSVVSVLYADNVGAAREIEPAAIELLCAVAGMVLEGLSARPSVRERAAEPAAGRLELPGSPTIARRPPADWDQMSTEERDLHLRAQRFARVLVADLQLYRAQEIREGKKAGDLYGRLREEIDKSRDVYQRKFGHTAAGSIDYFHVELLQTLADNQEDHLGPDYPGPMVTSLAG